MTRELRPEGLDFVERAPRLLTFTTEVAAPAEAVFDGIAHDPAEWAAWFPTVRSGAYTSPPPYGVGTKREIALQGARFTETIVAWDPGRCYAWRVDTQSRPLFKALIEEWTTTPVEHDPTRATVRWRFAVDPAPLFRAMLPAAPIVMERVFRKAMANLERRVERRP